MKFFNEFSASSDLVSMEDRPSEAYSNDGNAEISSSSSQKIHSKRTKQPLDRLQVFYLFLLWFLITWSRVYNQYHSLSQVIAGTVVGTVTAPAYIFIVQIYREKFAMVKGHIKKNINKFNKKSLTSLKSIYKNNTFSSMGNNKANNENNNTMNSIASTLKSSSSPPASPSPKPSNPITTSFESSRNQVAYSDEFQSRNPFHQEIHYHHHHHHHHHPPPLSDQLYASPSIHGQQKESEEISVASTPLIFRKLLQSSQDSPSASKLSSIFEQANFIADHQKSFGDDDLLNNNSGDGDGINNNNSNHSSDDVDHSNSLEDGNAIVLNE